MIRFARRFLLAFPLAALAVAGDIRVEVQTPKGEPVPDAVASLHPLDTLPVLVPPAAPVEILQIEEEFRPYVTAVMAGTRVTFPNRDAIQHHVYSLSKAKTFELPRFKNEPHEPVLCDRPGLIALGCNIHDWMSAYIVVLATPHFATTGDDGLAPLARVEPGRYRLDVWHPRVAAVVSREVNLDPADPATQVIAVTLRPDRRIRRAPEAGPGGYQ